MAMILRTRTWCPKCNAEIKIETQHTERPTLNEIRDMARALADAHMFSEHGIGEEKINGGT